MTVGMTPANREALISALSTLAEKIEANPPPIIGSDIFVRAAPGAGAIGSSISVTAGVGAGSLIGQRISVVAQPGQSAIGQRITVVAGDGQASAPPRGAASRQEILDAVTQLREAAKVLTSSSGSQGWINGILETVSKWGSAALSGAVSGATSAAMRFYLTGG